ncbi:lipid asymmetry maintenance protein MlaB [Candidatus Fukatsuia anoeciicola]|uniref:lipid asymmetry maintenance protein MlaB n=1 Tax=Candidatus Fukatsuia anoeciicola TaxID=2994492 RepID=UPI003463D25C
MTIKLDWELQQNILLLRGNLNHKTLLPLWQQSHTLLVGINFIDVTQLQRVDSSGLALLVHLQQRSYQHGTTLTISGISEQLKTLIKLYNLQQIIFY